MSLSHSLALSLSRARCLSLSRSLSLSLSLALSLALSLTSTHMDAGCGSTYRHTYRHTYKHTYKHNIDVDAHGCKYVAASPEYFGDLVMCSLTIECVLLLENVFSQVCGSEPRVLRAFGYVARGFRQVCVLMCVLRCILICLNINLFSNRMCSLIECVLL